MSTKQVLKLLAAAVGTRMIMNPPSSSIMTNISSSRDGRSYRVKKAVCETSSKQKCTTFSDTQQAADMLATVRQRLESFVSNLYNKYKDDRIWGADMRLLKKRFDPNVIVEGEHNTGITTFTRNKGESIRFCLRERDGTHRLHDINTIMYVAIHEVVHLMERDQNPNHKGRFKERWAWVLREAQKQGIWSYHDYASNPVSYCGIKIANNII